MRFQALQNSIVTAILAFSTHSLSKERPISTPLLDEKNLLCCVAGIDVLVHRHKNIHNHSYYGIKPIGKLSLALHVRYVFLMQS